MVCPLPSILRKTRYSTEYMNGRIKYYRLLSNQIDFRSPSGSNSLGTAMGSSLRWNQTWLAILVVKLLRSLEKLLSRLREERVSMLHVTLRLAALGTR